MNSETIVAEAPPASPVQGSSGDIRRRSKFESWPVVFSWSIWLACTVWMAQTALLQGARFPWSDEWNLVPYLAHARPVTLQWLWAQHVDHRIPAVKLVYVVLYRMFPGDFRAPILFDVGLMALSAAALIGAARLLRGRQSYADFFPAVLLMHMGLGIDVWGFKMQFVMSCTLASMVLAVWSSSRTARPGVLQSVFLAILAPAFALVGSNGLALSAGALALLGIGLCSQLRSSERSIGVIVALVLGMMGTILLDAYYLMGFTRVDHHWAELTVSSFLTMTVGVIAAPAGSLSFEHWGLVLALLAGIAGALGWKAWEEFERYRIGKRFSLIGIEVMCLSVIGLAMMVSFGRAAGGWTPDLAGHYSVLVIPLYAGLFLVAARLKEEKVSVAMAVFMAGVYCSQIPAGLGTSRDLRAKWTSEREALLQSSDVDTYVRSQTGNLFLVDTEETRRYVRDGVLALARQGLSTPLDQYSKFAIAVPDQRTIANGYARIVTHSGRTPMVCGRFSFHSNATEQFVAPLTNETVLDLKGFDPAEIGIALVNPDSRPNVVDLSMEDATRKVLRQASITLQPGMHVAKFAYELLTVDRKAVAIRCRAKLPFGVVALDISHGRAWAIARHDAAPLNETTVFPHFVSGGGWGTELVLSNPSKSVMTGMVQVKSSTGEQMLVTIDGKAATEFPYTLVPGETVKLAAAMAAR